MQFKTVISFAPPRSHRSIGLSSRGHFDHFFWAPPGSHRSICFFTFGRTHRQVYFLEIDMAIGPKGRFWRAPAGKIPYCCTANSVDAEIHRNLARARPMVNGMLLLVVVVDGVLAVVVVVVSCSSDGTHSPCPVNKLKRSPLELVSGVLADMWLGGDRTPLMYWRILGSFSMGADLSMSAP